MKSKTVTVHEGEDVGPIDFSHPSTVKIVDEYIAHHRVSVADLVECAEHPERFAVQAHDGFGYFTIVSFRLYDGWPYWYARPAFLIRGVLGAEWRWLDAYDQHLVRAR